MTRGVWFGLAAVFLAISGVAYFAGRPRPANVQAVVVSNPAPAQAPPQPTPAYQPPPQQPPETPAAPAAASSAGGFDAAPQQQPEPVQPEVLQTPTQLSPPDGSAFENVPRTTTLRWSPVANAVLYRVELDIGFQGSWTSEHPEWALKPAFYNTSQTTYTFDFVGMQPGRWRVWALDSKQRESPPSPWWEFNYLR